MSQKDLTKCYKSIGNDMYFTYNRLLSILKFKANVKTSSKLWLENLRERSHKEVCFKGILS